MTRVLSTAEQADVVAERDRVAWNLPGSSARATAHAPPTPAARNGLAAVPALDIDGPAQDATVEHDLDWQGFLSRYYPGRRRHDFEALTAYGVYRSSGGVDVRPAGEVARLGESEPVPPESTATDSWEDEGGAAR
jgi:hypothetical protein